MVQGSATALFLASLCTVSCLSACSGSSSEPTLVTKALGAPVPFDGAIHIQKGGAFVMRPHIRMCVANRLVPAMRKKLNACVRAGYRPIIVGVMQAGGEPGDLHKLTGYKLVLAAWQNDPFGRGALWIGSISRRAGTLNPNAAPTVDAISSYSGTRTQMLEYMSVGWDIFALSKAFVRALPDGDEKDRVTSEAARPTAGKRDKVAKFVSFLSDKRIVSPMSEDEFRRGGAWTETFEGVTFQRTSGTWKVSEDDDGLLVLCKTVTERGFSPRQIRLNQPETDCSTVKPFYSAGLFIDLPISPYGVTPRVVEVPSETLTDPAS